MNKDMMNDCCGSQLYHTGTCCHDEELQETLAREVMSQFMAGEMEKKSCGCGGKGKKEAGSCGCGGKGKKQANSFSDLTYAGSGCACGGNCGC